VPSRPQARERPPLPPPLPPETRTVGQLVAETLRLYGRRFWPSLSLGVGPAILGFVAIQLGREGALVFVPLAGAFVLTASYVGATLLASDATPARSSLLVALVAGALVFVPVPFLASVFVLPSLIWLALVGLVVPVAVIEGRPLRGSFARAVALARADYVHALGSLATLTLTVFLTRVALFFLLRGFGDATALAAGFLSDLVLSPILFLGSALLYFDQAARVGSGSRKRSRRKRDAHVHHADHAHGTGRPDAEVQP
jgi:hypothetical protein